MSKETGVYSAPWEKSFNRILTPLEEFIHRQTTSGILLMICAAVALVIANSPWHTAYEELLYTKVAISLGDGKFALSIHHWINEALMALFFFVMGLELKRELTVGELSSPRQALLPIMAAIGGMIVPALCYIALNAGGDGAKGWAIPMATDIAFAIGALSLLGARVPKSLVTFLIALAIVDDLGAVAVIALFYTSSIDIQALLYAAGFTMLLGVLNRGGVRHSLPYAAIGLLLWVAMLAAGIHATIAGIVVAFMIPIRPKLESELFIRRIRESADAMEEAVNEDPDIIHNSKLRSLVGSLGDGANLAQAPAQRMEHSMHLPVAYLVIPIFALANAGIPIDFANFLQQLNNPISLGVILGLVVGKPLGIVLFTLLTLKMGWASMPEGINLQRIIGVGLLAGIGFTMSIFIADLGFDGVPTDLLAAKTGIILASLIAGVSGVIVLIAGNKQTTTD